MQGLSKNSSLGWFKRIHVGRGFRLGAAVLACGICLAASPARAVDVVDAGATARGLTRIETRSFSLTQLSKLDVTLSVLQGSAYADLQEASNGRSVGLIPEGSSSFSPLGAGNYLIYIYSTIPGNYTLSTLASSVPEPSGIALLLSGIFLTALMYPFRRKYVDSLAALV